MARADVELVIVAQEERPLRRVQRGGDVLGLDAELPLLLRLSDGQRLATPLALLLFRRNCASAGRQGAGRVSAAADGDGPQTRPGKHHQPGPRAPAPRLPHRVPSAITAGTWLATRAPGTVRPRVRSSAPTPRRTLQLGRPPSSAATTRTAAPPVPEADAAAEGEREGRLFSAAAGVRLRETLAPVVPGDPIACAAQPMPRVLVVGPVQGRKGRWARAPVDAVDGARGRVQ